MYWILSAGATYEVRYMKSPLLTFPWMREIISEPARSFARACVVLLAYDISTHESSQV